ncbi:hypothetical protein PF004_g31310 [Phytophthora fragariae]|uniref:Uncharacterized protein n=1 Tax=Phytophthora fragariae TaxID=53985 RepID=A0A6G0MA55_9STRA|nr:hypothetical protein PF004_g31310 [Phytophthora fragariae]
MRIPLATAETVMILLLDHRTKFSVASLIQHPGEAGEKSGVAADGKQATKERGGDADDERLEQTIAAGNKLLYDNENKSKDDFTPLMLVRRNGVVCWRVEAVCEHVDILRWFRESASGRFVPLPPLRGFGWGELRQTLLKSVLSRREGS